MMIMMVLMMGSIFILPLLLIGSVAVALGFRPQFNQSRPAKTSHTPLEILKDRFTRGEVSSTEYEQGRRDLEG
jgi:uncharacterized membrane protein